MIQLRECYPKMEYYGIPYTKQEIKLSIDKRLKGTVQKYENLIHDKKAEICKLKERLNARIKD